MAPLMFGNDDRGYDFDSAKHRDWAARQQYVVEPDEDRAGTEPCS